MSLFRVFAMFLSLVWAAAAAGQTPKTALPAADSLLAAGEAEAAGEMYRAWGEQLLAQKEAQRAAGVFQQAGKIFTDEAQKFEKGVAAYSRALEIFRAVKDKKKEATVLYQMAGCYQQSYDYPNALPNYLEAEHLFESMNDAQGLGMVLIDLAQLYRDCSEMLSAIEAGGRALKIHETLRDTGFIAYDLQSLAMFNDETEHYDKALELYFKALELSETPDPNLLNNIANTFKNKKEYPQALDYAEKALKTALDSGDEYYLPAIYSTLCEIHIRLNELPAALEFGQKCLEHAQSQAGLEMIKIAQINLSDIYERMGDMSEALRYFKGYISARDSISNDEKNREITRRSLKFQFDKEQEVAAAELGRQKILTYAFIGGFVLMLALAGLIFRNFRREQQTKRLIAREKQKSDELLLNILPATAAEELKTTGHSPARQFERATVLFSDFKDFTRVSELVSPADLVKMIDFYFSEFDRIVTRHGIEKIKTVGDAYVCANGLNTQGTDQPQAVVRAALEIQDFVAAAKREAQMAEKPYFECRIGINTGPVVAGVVGLKKFTYDIWSDTVNVAARMEQNGEPGRINLSESTYQLVCRDFDCQFRGKIEAKNKGEINMYFVG